MNEPPIAEVTLDEFGRIRESVPREWNHSRVNFGGASRRENLGSVKGSERNGVVETR